MMEVCSGITIDLPTNIVIAGSTNSGKSFLTLNLLKNKQIFHPQPEQIVYLYKNYQPEFAKHSDHIQFINSLKDFHPTGRITILVIDDQLMQLTDEIANYFIAGRHSGISVIFLTQNIFHNDKRVRTINANSNHFVFLRSPRSLMQLHTLARQCIAKDNIKNLIQAYNDATESKYGYIWINLDPRVQSHMMVTSNICPTDESFPVLYKL